MNFQYSVHFAIFGYLTIFCFTIFMNRNEKANRFSFGLTLKVYFSKKNLKLFFFSYFFRSFEIITNCSYPFWKMPIYLLSKCRRFVLSMTLSFRLLRNVALTINYNNYLGRFAVCDCGCVTCVSHTWYQ